GRVALIARLAALCLRRTCGHRAHSLTAGAAVVLDVQVCRDIGHLALNAKRAALAGAALRFTVAAGAGETTTAISSARNRLPAAAALGLSEVPRRREISKTKRRASRPR